MTNSCPKAWLFPRDLNEAKAVQKEMAQRVLLENRFGELNQIGGMDVSNTPFDPNQMIFGAAVVLFYPSMAIEERATAEVRQEFPYIPGFLGFRELPVLVRAYEQLTTGLDIILVDGHGVSHPRGLGVASHLGVVLDLPTIGVAKSLLVGTLAAPLGEEAGSVVPVIWKGREIAMALRSKKRCTPLIISAGHKITLHSAVALVQKCLKGYRLPEPTRHAHLTAGACRKAALV